MRHEKLIRLKTGCHHVMQLIYSIGHEWHLTDTSSTQPEHYKSGTSLSHAAACVSKQLIWYWSTGHRVPWGCSTGSDTHDTSFNSLLAHDMLTDVTWPLLYSQRIGVYQQDVAFCFCLLWYKRPLWQTVMVWQYEGKKEMCGLLITL